MIKATHLLTLTLCSTLLIACSDKQQDSQDNDNKHSTSGSVFQEQIDTLDKARNVEDALQKASQQQRQTIDSQSR